MLTGPHLNGRHVANHQYPFVSFTHQSRITPQSQRDACCGVAAGWNRRRRPTVDKPFQELVVAIGGGHGPRREFGCWFAAGDRFPGLVCGVPGGRRSGVQGRAGSFPHCRGGTGLVQHHWGRQFGCWDASGPAGCCRRLTAAVATTPMTTPAARPLAAHRHREVGSSPRKASRASAARATDPPAREVSATCRAVS